MSIRETLSTIDEFVSRLANEAALAGDKPFLDWPLWLSIPVLAIAALFIIYLLSRQETESGDYAFGAVIFTKLVFGMLSAIVVYLGGLALLSVLFMSISALIDEDPYLPKALLSVIVIVDVIAISLATYLLKKYWYDRIKE